MQSGKSDELRGEIKRLIERYLINPRSRKPKLELEMEFLPMPEGSSDLNSFSLAVFNPGTTEETDLSVHFSTSELMDLMGELEEFLKSQGYSLYFSTNGDFLSYYPIQMDKKRISRNLRLAGIITDPQ